MNNAIKILIPAIISFVSGILLTPVFTHYFYKYKLWRRTSRINVAPSDNFKKIYEDQELRTPRIGGVIVWMSVVATIFVIFLISVFIDTDIALKINFINRSETLLPFGALILASLIGLGDDFIQIFAYGKLSGDPILLRYLKIGIIFTLGLIIGWWFYSKLGMNSIHIPFDGTLYLGFLFIPFFILVMLAVFSSSVIDGIDGLSGGVLVPVFVGYTIIAYGHGQFNLSAFCAVIASGILAFLWFNIPPARFYMGETGMIGLTVTLSVIAFLTDTVLLLPIIAFPLFITSVSVVIQMTARKFFNGKKIFIVAPLHHHFESIGWPKYKVTMRYWIVSIMTSTIGVVLVFLQ
ncbi:MAG: phospho-N-acetylmuramoyl-pentapeptide-transferase [Patescibacteria group bacterium]|nr:phospho-N-acetylmuramoyl-pentapeptide-transferase [Patescibacteria group bacterium]